MIEKNPHSAPLAMWQATLLNREPNTHGQLSDLQPSAERGLTE